MRARLIGMCMGLCVALAPAHLAAQVESSGLEAGQLRLYQGLLAELRCLVCANQNLADSNSALAKDLRARVRELILQGATRAEIVDYMTARYGDYVLYRPPLSAATALLWFGPAVLLVVVVAVVFRRRFNSR